LIRSETDDFSFMLWRRLDAPGHDACRLEQRDFAYRLRGTAVYAHANGSASISYRVECDAQWRTISGRIAGFIGQRSFDFVVAREDVGWTLNGSPKPGLDHLVDLDLSFTPATNLLQLKRVAIAEGEAVPLPAAWLDVDEGTLTELPQFYQRRGPSTFWYRAPSVGYEGLLQLAPNGFIQNYPNLWQAEPMD
jgi:uncharacterized protein